MRQEHRQSFAPFMRLWVGQVVSLLGSAMTRFVLGVYLWQKTGEALPIVLVGVVASMATVVTSLVAGVIVDRISRKRILIASDSGSAVVTMLMLFMMASGQGETWQIYIAVMVGAACGTFQRIAFTSSVSGLVAKAQLGRANSLMSLAEYIALIAAPLAAGAALPFVGIAGVLLIDLCTFLVAMMTLVFTHFPPLETSEVVEERAVDWRGQVTFGFRYILGRRSFSLLLLILILFASVEAIGYALLVPMILARSGGSEAALAAVQSVMGLGGIVGGIIVSAWGGTKRRIIGLLIGIIATGLLGDLLMGLGQNALTWGIAAIGIELFIPLVISSHRSIWQAKVPPAAQGRVFAALTFAVSLAEPVAGVAGGLLADRVLEPGMQSGGWLAPIFGGLVGVGSGAGMALLFVLSGTLLGGIGLCALCFPSIRQLDTLIPDHDEAG